MKSSKKKALTVTLGAILMVVTIGITYAFISQILTGTKKVVINAGTLDLVLEEENEITISDALPMYDQVGMIQEDVFEFKLVNNSKTAVNYKLKLEDATPETINLQQKCSDIGVTETSSSLYVYPIEFRKEALNFCKNSYDTVNTEEDCVEISNFVAQQQGMGTPFVTFDDVMDYYIEVNSLENPKVKVPASCVKIDYPDELRTEALAICNSVASSMLEVTVTTEDECVSTVKNIFPEVKTFEDVVDLEIENGYITNDRREIVETYPNNFYDAIVDFPRLNESDVKYYLTKEGIGVPKLLSNLPYDGTVDSGEIAGNSELNYTLRLWIDSSVTDEFQISGKSLSYKIGVEANQKQEKVKLTLGGQEFEVEETTATFPNFLSTLGRGIYKYTEDGEDIYYWRGKVTNNHVVFAGFCWEMVRTTKNGGIKMIYDGLPVETGGILTCPNTGTASQLTNLSQFQSIPIAGNGSPAYVGYMYGNAVYEYISNDASDNKDNIDLAIPGFLYGYDVDWDGTKYILKAKEGNNLFESTGVPNNDFVAISNGNHYTCFDTTDNCTTIYYIVKSFSDSLSYIKLTGGATIEKALEQMYRNEQPSTIKTAIETWFEDTDLVDEENLKKIEDTVYCNDRSVEDNNWGGWTKDGDISNDMFHSTMTRLKRGEPDLSCRNDGGNRDRFTYEDIVNGNGLLKYPVGLLTVDELVLAGGIIDRMSTSFYLYTGQDYWTMSPSGNRPFSNIKSSVFYVHNSSALYDGFVSGFNYSGLGIRPVITLANGVTFTDGGLGTETSPFVVE